MKKLNIDLWHIQTTECSSQTQSFNESIFSQGNGYMGVRGFVAHDTKQNLYERTIFLSGFFDYIKPGITDMVNTPDFWSTSIQQNDQPVNSSSCKIIYFNQEINMVNGLLSMQAIYEDNKCRQTKVECERFLSIDNVHIAAIRYKITPINYNGTIEFQTGIDGDVANNPISDNQLTENKDVIIFWRSIKNISDDESGYLCQQTNISRRKIEEAYSLSYDKSQVQTIKGVLKEKYVGSKIEVNAVQGNTYMFDKFITVFCYRDTSEIDTEHSVKQLAISCVQKGFERLLQENTQKWLTKWMIADIKIDGDKEIQGALRYNIFQLIQINAENDPNSSIGARGLMHGRYKGCYFWDTEIFMLPFYIYTNPKAAKNLLMYRYNTLQDALKNAAGLSLKGARYPWMCSDSGVEQCETWDTGCCEVHITADIAYAIGNYVKVTKDIQFLVDYGTEMYIQTARYWVSRFTYDPKNDVYNMLFVKGPDEYCGVTTNNAFTNIMAINNLKLAKHAIALLKSDFPHKWQTLERKLEFSEVEIASWENIIKKAKINYDNEKDLYIQDDLFMALEELDIGMYKTDDIPLYHTISYDRLQRYRVLKQSDVLLLMTLLPEQFTIDQKGKAWDCYEPLTLHDSTLSFGTHAQLAAQLGKIDRAEEYFSKSLFLDLYDVMKNTGREGIHPAALGATWQAFILGFCGLSETEVGLKIKPNLPKNILSVCFNIYFKGNLWNITVCNGGSTILKKQTGRIND